MNFPFLDAQGRPRPRAEVPEARAVPIRQGERPVVPQNHHLPAGLPDVDTFLAHSTLGDNVKEYGWLFDGRSSNMKKGVNRTTMEQPDTTSP